MTLIPICALFAALALFWLSTRQWPALWRLAIWTAGAGAIVAATALLLTERGHFGLFRAVADLVEHWDHPGDSILMQALDRNSRTVANFVLQVLDLFVVMAAIIGLAALWALTPGIRTERALRPTIFATAGFSMGALTALAVVAIGFGGQIHPRNYLGELALEDIHDGDTFWVGETSLRLWGVDAPELHQKCVLRDSSNIECGELARRQFHSLIDGAILRCVAMESRRGTVRESFGRPLVQCFARREGQQEFDPAAELVRTGFAVPYEGDGFYQYDDEAAEGRGNGVMVACSLRPDVWRRNRTARAAFEGGQRRPEGAFTMGDCE